jgi:hypothetical protein
MPFLPIGCQQNKMSIAEEVVEVNTEDTLLLNKQDSLYTVSSDINETSTDTNTPFYAPLLIRESGVTGLGILTVDMKYDLETILSLRLYYILVLISLVMILFKRNVKYKIVFVFGVIALFCLLMVFVFNYKELLYGFYITLSICIVNTILSWYIWKKEKSSSST